MPLPTLSERILRELKSIEVVFVDDAYDEEPVSGNLSYEDLQAFGTELEDSEDALAELERCIGKTLNPSDAIVELDNDVLVTSLWQMRNANQVLSPILTNLFSRFVRLQAEKVRSLNVLNTTLGTEIGLQITTLGKRNLDQIPETAKILFIDYYLTDNQNAIELNENLKLIKEQIGRHLLGQKPMVVLMSSREISPTEQKEFRMGADVLAGQFRFVNKTELEDVLSIKLLLNELIDHYPLASQIEQTIGMWETILNDAKESFCKNIKSLDVADYQAIQRLRLDEEGISLGAYATWIYSTYFQSLVEGHETMQKAVSKLSSIDFETKPPVSIVPSREIAEIYQSLVFSQLRIDGFPLSHYLQVDENETVPIALGDLFIEVADSQVANAIPSPLLVVTPECDLARRNPDQTVILLVGTLKKKIDVSWPVNPEKFELFIFNNIEYVVSWDYKSIKTRTHYELSRQLIDGEIKHIARMRSLYALKQQHFLTSHIARVGTEVPPHEYEAYTGIVFFRGSGTSIVHQYSFEVGSDLIYLIHGKTCRHLTFLPEAIERLRTEARRDEVVEGTREVLNDINVLRMLRGPIDVNKEYQPTYSDDENRILIKISKGDSPVKVPMQINSTYRMQINLHRKNVEFQS